MLAILAAAWWARRKQKARRRRLPLSDAIMSKKSTSSVELLGVLTDAWPEYILYEVSVLLQDYGKKVIPYEITPPQAIRTWPHLANYYSHAKNLFTVVFSSVMPLCRYI